MSTCSAEDLTDDDVYEDELYPLEMDMIGAPVKLALSERTGSLGRFFLIQRYDLWPVAVEFRSSSSAFYHEEEVGYHDTWIIMPATSGSRSGYSLFTINGQQLIITTKGSFLCHVRDALVYDGITVFDIKMDGTKLTFCGFGLSGKYIFHHGIHYASGAHITCDVFSTSSYVKPQDCYSAFLFVQPDSFSSVLQLKFMHASIQQVQIDDLGSEEHDRQFCVLIPIKEAAISVRLTTKYSAHVNLNLKTLIPYIDVSRPFRICFTTDPLNQAVSCWCCMSLSKRHTQWFTSLDELKRTIKQ